jgi:alpha-N-arabinofuranosidase
VFLVNRSQHEVLMTDVIWQGVAPARATAIYQLSGADSKVINTFERPNMIVPKQLEGTPVRDGRITLRLPPLSFTVVTTAGYDSGHQ